MTIDTHPLFRCSVCGETRPGPKEYGCPSCHADAGQLFDATLKAGDRVMVYYRSGRAQNGELPPFKERHGILLGENRTKTAWRVQVDGLAVPIGYHKTKVFREEQKPLDAADPPQAA